MHRLVSYFKTKLTEYLTEVKQMPCYCLIYYQGHFWQENQNEWLHFKILPLSEYRTLVRMSVLHICYAFYMAPAMINTGTL